MKIILVQSEPVPEGSLQSPREAGQAGPRQGQPQPLREQVLQSQGKRFIWRTDRVSLSEMVQSKLGHSEIYFYYQEKQKQASIWEKEKGKGTGIVGGWKIGPDKKSRWSIIKETFFTPLGSHQSGRKARGRKSSRKDAETFPGTESNCNANVVNSCRNLLTKIIRSKQKENQYSRHNGFLNRILVW